MKKTVVLAMIMALSAAVFTACSSTGSSTQVQEPVSQTEDEGDAEVQETETQEETKQNAAEAVTEAANTQETEETPEQGGGYESEETPVEPQNAQTDTTVAAQYFTVTLPESWSGAYEYVIREPEDGSYQVSFYEASDYETNGSGHLFTIALFPEDADYTMYPSYEVVSAVTGPNGESYTLVTIDPSDVQFSLENETTYLSMIDQKSEVLSSLILADGYSMN